MIIHTKEDWWACLRGNLDRFEETFYNIYHDGAKYQELVKAAQTKDNEVAHAVLNDAWADAPDKFYIHSWPGWGDLCDLCSEYWVFQPEEPEAGAPCP